MVMYHAETFQERALLILIPWIITQQVRYYVHTRKVNAYRERMRIIVNVEQIKVVQPYESGSVVSMSESEWDRIYELTKIDKGKCEMVVVLETWTADF